MNDLVVISRKSSDPKRHLSMYLVKCLLNVLIALESITSSASSICIPSTLSREKSYPSISLPAVCFLLVERFYGMFAFIRLGIEYKSWDLNIPAVQVVRDCTRDIVQSSGCHARMMRLNKRVQKRFAGMLLWIGQLEL